MKSMYRYILAGLLVGAATVQAQMSAVSVNSDSGSGANVRITGIIASQAVLVDIAPGSTSPSYYGFTNYFGSYYTAPANTGVTVHAPPPGGSTTTITNQYAPGIGYTGTAPFTSVSGRFYIESGVTVYDDEGSHVEGGTQAILSFTVGSSNGFSLQILGSSLSAYGLSGASNPTGYVYGPGGFITGFSGEGGTSLGTLGAGTYTVVVYADDDTTSGIVVASVNAQ
jgi:hypothetical protein